MGKHRLSEVVVPSPELMAPIVARRRRQVAWTIMGVGAFALGMACLMLEWHETRFKAMCGMVGGVVVMCVLAWRFDAWNRRVRAMVIEREGMVCPNCAYALPLDAESGICPECGRAFEAERLCRNWPHSWQKGMWS